MCKKPVAAGHSSFDIVDRGVVFQELDLSRSRIFLDAACGTGKYTLEAASKIDEFGVITAVDLWEAGIRNLKEEVAVRNLSQIRALTCDISRQIPAEPESVDTCLLATVLHDLAIENIHMNALHEIFRVMKKDGKLVIVEFKKIDGPPGPPIHIRLAPEQLTEMVCPVGFDFRHQREAGPYTYLSTFVKG
ncbi:MAG: class I SAM-dependent methyltransferase [Desulfobacteraceae bacterium]|nr:class I SAM-dependent methyltransferase [Desulfobacteraceae bacterium]